MTRSELIAALEKADGPSRTLDRDICLVCKEVPRVLREIPHFTSSIDAALTLVPEGFAANVTIAGNGGHGTSATVFGAGDSDSGYAPHRVPAIALCIAALKAGGD